jgi:hypothetical protein
VLRLPKPPRLPGSTGRPPKHGPEFALDKPATWPEPAHTTTTDTTRYGTATATSWDRLHPRPVWLWSSATGATAADVDRCWQSFLRRFDLEHTFRLLKQTLGWTAPEIHTPQAADR